MNNDETHALLPTPSRLGWGTVVLIATVFWAYISFTTVAQWDLMLQAVPSMPSLESGVNTATCALLFPILVLLTLVANRIGYDLPRLYRVLPLHLALALVFALCSRPIQVLARAAVTDLTLYESYMRMLGPELPVPAIARLWASAGLYDGMQYVFLQVLVAGITYYTRFRHEQALRESLAVQYDRARLNALRMQINPHFLFNTLSAIAGLVRANPAAAEGMVTRLGELFRRVLGERDVEMVTLEQELDYAENYLEIQRIRFEERLTYRIDVDPALRKVRVPPLLLQPLLENAVEHGLRRNEGALEISLAGRVNDGRVDIVIRNASNGAEVDGPLTNGHGLGLKNVRERLEAAYNGAGELSFRNLRPGEFESRVSIPRMPEPAMAEMNA